MVRSTFQRPTQRERHSEAATQRAGHASQRAARKTEESEMAVYKQSKSKYWWYKFFWNGELIRESTKQTNKRVAEQMEAAHRTALAKGEVGIRERKVVPTLAEFADQAFLPFVRATSKEKPNTVRFYENSVENLKAYGKLASLRLDTITSDVVAGFVAHRQAQRQKRRNNKALEVSTVNRDLATLRRMFH